MKLTSVGRIGVASIAVVAGAVAFGSVESSSRGQARAAAPPQHLSWLVGRAGPTVFAPGACVAFAPVRRWNGHTVFLDPGHGGRDSGAVTTSLGRSLSETDLTLAIARRTLRMLERRGFRVVISRLRDSRVVRLGRRDTDGRLLTAAGVHRDLVARDACANVAKADVLVAIHLNAFPDPAVSGSQTIYNAHRSFRTRNLRLATLLQRSVLRSLAAAGSGGHSRGIVTDGSVGGIPLTPEAAAYGHLIELGPAAPPWFRRPSRMPGAVIEPLFLSNPGEARLALTRAGQAAIARGLTTGLAAYFQPTDGKTAHA